MVILLDSYPPFKVIQFDNMSHQNSVYLLSFTSYLRSKIRCTVLGPSTKRKLKRVARSDQTLISGTNWNHCVLHCTLRVVVCRLYRFIVLTQRKASTTSFHLVSTLPVADRIWGWGHGTISFVLISCIFFRETDKN